MHREVYANEYDPATNAKGYDSSPRNNPAPQGARIKSKRNIRRAAKKHARQLMKSLIKEQS